MFSERTSWRLERNRYTDVIDTARARGARLLDLTASNPTRVGLKYDSAAILDALRSERALDYDPQAKGLLVARQSVAKYYETLAYGEREVADNVSTTDAGSKHATVDPERIVLTASTSEGYSYVFRLLCNAGDEVLAILFQVDQLVAVLVPLIEIGAKRRRHFLGGELAVIVLVALLELRVGVWVEGSGVGTGTGPTNLRKRLWNEKLRPVMPRLSSTSNTGVVQCSASSW